MKTILQFRIKPGPLLKRMLVIPLVFSLLASCSPVEPQHVYITPMPMQATEDQPAPAEPTPIATRPVYQPGTLVDYAAQTGDTLPAVAAHFNTTVGEILEANPGIAADVTTLTPGENLRIPIYYEALWGNPFQILPDALFVYGPAQSGFDTHAFVDSMPGWVKTYRAQAGEKTRIGGDVVEYVARAYSVSPRLLLALAEYQAQALTSPVVPDGLEDYPLGYEEQSHQGLYLQLVWAANLINNAYYSWRTGSLDTITRTDGSIEHPDPWQNAATVALQNYFAGLLEPAVYQDAIYSEGFYRTYSELFGDPWLNPSPHIPGGLQQPALALPFAIGQTWAFTGGPHTAYGTGEPRAAIDFAPPTVVGGCSPSDEFVIAIADGQIVRTEPAIAVLDLDKDGDENTGWVIFYLHLGTNNKVNQGILVKEGDPIGHPSCEGGRSTGTHVHIARKYNGEWIQADGPLAFNLEGWIAGNGKQEYEGTLKKHGRTVEACVCSDAASHITAGKFD